MFTFKVPAWIGQLSFGSTGDVWDVTSLFFLTDLGRPMQVDKIMFESGCSSKINK